jgi:hypothetical protein
MRRAFADQLETSDGGGLEREAPDLGGAKARGSDEMELGVCIEQPQGDRVNPEGGEDGVGDTLDG